MAQLVRMLFRRSGMWGLILHWTPGFLMFHSQVLIFTSHEGNGYCGSQARIENVKLIPLLAPVSFTAGFSPDS